MPDIKIAAKYPLKLPPESIRKMLKLFVPDDTEDFGRLAHAFSDFPFELRDLQEAVKQYMGQSLCDETTWSRVRIITE